MILVALIASLINKYHPNFVTEEKGSRWEEVLSQDDPIATLLQNYEIPYHIIDISENAEGYLYANNENNYSKFLFSFIF